jgi:hypothetical protein
MKSNMTSFDFDIIKAEVEIINNGDKQRLICSVKYRKPGDYLIAIRNRTGVEAARIYITGDTLMINDRIHRKLYCGSNEYLLEKYGIGTKALPLVFGDYFDKLLDSETIKECVNGITEIRGYLEKKELWYFLDCNKFKVTGVSISEKEGYAGISMKFSDFVNIGERSYPAKIDLSDITERTKIEIQIVSVEYDKNDKLEFIPGRNYEKIVLK